MFSFLKTSNVEHLYLLSQFQKRNLSMLASINHFGIKDNFRTVTQEVKKKLPRPVRTLMVCGQGSSAKSL
jgi:hypothetical protein